MTSNTPNGAKAKSAMKMMDSGDYEDAVGSLVDALYMEVSVNYRVFVFLVRCRRLRKLELIVHRLNGSGFFRCFLISI